MNTQSIKTTIFNLFLLAALFMPSISSANLLLGASKKVIKEEVVVPSDLAPEQVGDFIAPLNEQQVRNLLIKRLEEQASNNAENNTQQSMSVLALLKGARNPDSPLGKGIHATITATHSFWPEVKKIFETITPGEGVSGFLKLLTWLAIIVLLARAIEWLCTYRWLQRVQNTYTEQADSPTHTTKGYAFKYFFINLIGLFVFSIASYIIVEFFAADGSAQHSFIVRLFEEIIAFRLFTSLFKLIIFPKPRGLALIDGRINHIILYLCMACFTFAILIGPEMFFIFKENGLPAEHGVLYSMFLYGLIVNPIIFWFVWTQRQDIDRIMFGTIEEKTLNNGTYLYAARAIIWPSAVTFVISLAYLNWLLQGLIGDMDRRKSIEIAWWITLLFPIIDLLVSSLLIRLVSLRIFQNKSFQRRKHRLTFIFRSIVRLILLTMLVISFLDAWGFQPLEKLSSSSGISILSSAVDIGVTILLGLIIWEAIQLWMERHLPDEDESESSEVEGEGGGSAASRSETLLPLFRTILLILLTAIVIMSILYSLGVQIGPLLAGASVVGIAIGFGSQKLVQDIISGMFFLIDDAFRKGEYVEVAGMRGTIEKLSVRSMRLRHHLGAVQTVPYGEINTVKNLSRDWVIMKLELRLPYNVDIEKVRKIIKKVGQQMMLDETTGPNMLQPLKSQGVMRVEESALIIRMKFTAKPGEQWIVRRVAYTKVRDALSDAGIQFAHREVKVIMPEELEELQKMEYKNKLKMPTEQAEDTRSHIDSGIISGAVTAAAMSAVVASELAQQNKIDDDGPGEEQ